MARQIEDSEVVRARSEALCGFFGRYMHRFMQRNFHAVRISRSGQPRLPSDRPAIIYTNHPSWWDPAFFIVLATIRFPDRPGYGPMD